MGHTNNMVSLKLAVCVCVLFNIGIEAAPEPKPEARPCWPPGCAGPWPPSHYREGGSGGYRAPPRYPTRSPPYFNPPFYNRDGGSYPEGILYCCVDPLPIGPCGCYCPVHKLGILTS